MADQHRATAPDPEVAAFQATAEAAMVDAARTVHEHHQRRWDAVALPLARAARDVVDNAVTVQGLARIPAGLFAAICQLERAAAAIDRPDTSVPAACLEPAAADPSAVAGRDQQPGANPRLHGPPPPGDDWLGRQIQAHNDRQLAELRDERDCDVDTDRTARPADATP